MVNEGRILEEPWRRPFRSERLYVSRESWLFAVVQAPGVRVLYDLHGRVYVRLDPSYRGLVGGHITRLVSSRLVSSHLISSHLILSALLLCPRHP